MEHNHVPELVAEIRRGKALARVVQSATVKDASGNVVELKTLQPDGTYAEPGAVDDDSEDGGVVESAEESQPPVARDASADIQVLGGSDFVRIEDAADTQAEPAGEA
jgi:hypothetical protein